MIKELLENWGEVNLFTRPRRFGKSLNMSMLKHFFEYGTEESLFDGLKISKERELCTEYMGKFPVISITLKGVFAADFDSARAMLCTVIGNEAARFRYLLESEQLSDVERASYVQLTTVGKSGESKYPMTDDVLIDSLRSLSWFLFKHYGKQVILLIDEYDVPLDKARQFGYYDKMINLLRNLFGQVLKTNESLYFAVLTGCLRIAKESIFTGLNNLHVLSITDLQYDEYFGFSDSEVREILEYYGFSEKYDQVKKWYDGYCFGRAEIYCPWDVIKYCTKLRSESNAEPQAFWVNTSENEVIRKFLQKATPGTKIDLEQLIEGNSVWKKINQELTYRDLYKDLDNLWSLLFMTGYLTQRGKQEENLLELVIPNFEIRKIFVEQIMEWFQEEARKDTLKLNAFCEAFLQGDAKKIEKDFNAYLLKTISIRDTGVRKAKKENFYHGILLGLLSHREDWWVKSNEESGNGFSDILIEYEEKEIGVVIEIKYPEDGNLEKGCKEALDQIKRMGYETKLIQDGMKKIIWYGIACNKKNCMVDGETKDI